MVNKYKVIISNQNIYKEIELPLDKNKIIIGTNLGCDVRLHKDLFFEPIELTLINIDDKWHIFCSDNLYLTKGNSKKLINIELLQGDIYIVKYQIYDQDVFQLEFLIDFENNKKKYDRIIEISKNQSIKIGTNCQNDIILLSEYAKNEEVELNKVNDNYELVVINSVYDVYYNGLKVNKKCMIYNFDFFSVADYIFYYKNGYLWTEIRDDVIINNLQVQDQVINQYPCFKRNTRIKPFINKDKITILDPPSKPKKQKSNLFISLLPSIGMLIISCFMGFMGGTMIIFGILSASIAMITSIATVIQNKRDFKKETKERIIKYTKYAENKKQEIQQARDEERQILEEKYISLNEEENQILNFSSDLFDRQVNDDDFLNIRLGTGNIISLREIDYKKQEKLEIEDDLQLIPENYAKTYKILEDAPVICDLKTNNAIGIIGQEENRFSLLKNMIIDLCARHFYSDVEFFFLANNEHKERIRWLRFLPYVQNNITHFRNIAYDDESKNRIFDYLYKELSNRQKENNDKQFIVFFYDECDFQVHPISKFINDLNEKHMTFIFMADKKSDIPQGCIQLIKVSQNSGKLINVVNQNENINFTFKTIDDLNAKKIIDFLTPVYTQEISLESTLTKNISLFELLNILVVEDLDLNKRWKNSQVFKSMAAPIGVSKNEIITLDLHDKAHGPHGLVAGTTGSGKSELLQTYILSMATLFHPYEVAFLIIDFKGGGMVNQFKDLPHLLGAITNIDGKEINRSLKSIKAELQKRQRLFAQAEVNHIDKYIKKYKEKKVTTPIPHLIVIVDEFAELKAEQPDFMKELISAARIGRSLGVHLILATQKPSGQVDDQIWSNSRFKLCLKVQSPEDSNEVLKSPLAAEIKEAGRAYLQVGTNEIFELFQSAYSGALAQLSNTHFKKYTLSEVNDFGKSRPVFIQEKNTEINDKTTQLESIVQYVHDYCLIKNIEQLPNICLEPLSKMEYYPENLTKWKNGIAVGIYDDPDNQIQDKAYIDIDNNHTLIIGSSQYGKTNLLQSMIKSIALNTNPQLANIYIIDFGSMILKNFEELKHVGGVVCPSDDEKLKNLFKLLSYEISSRKEKLLSYGLSSYASYLESGYTDIPRIYLFIDNLTALIEMYLQDDDVLLNILREGLAVGINVVITNLQTTGIGYRYLANFSNKIAFYCNDNSEYINLFDSNHLIPDSLVGRCIFQLNKVVLECQTYLAFSGEKEIDRVKEMKKFIIETNSKYSGKGARKIPVIPTLLTVDLLKQDFGVKFNNYKLPIGLTYNNVEPYYLNLSQLGIMGLCGKENTGHKNFINHLINYLEHIYKDFPSRVVIFDDITHKFNALKDHSIVTKYTLEVNDIKDILENWHELLEKQYQLILEGKEVHNELLLLIIQNNDVAKVINDNFDLMDKFNDMIHKFKGMNVSIIFTNYSNTSLSYDAPEPMRIIKEEKHILYFEDLDNLKPFDVPYDELRLYKKKLEIGDAYYIQDNNIVKLKMVKFL